MKASDKDGTMSSASLTAVTKKAGLLLEAQYPGRHRDKRIAGDLDVSTRTARYLRRGCKWTLATFIECYRLHGGEFIRYALGAAPDDLEARTVEGARAIADFEAHIAKEGNHAARIGARAAAGAIGELAADAALPSGKGTPSAVPQTARPPSRAVKSVPPKVGRVGKDRGPL